MKKFFKFYGELLEFGSDNGREFINSSVCEFLNENNIKLVKGLPYTYSIFFCPPADKSITKS